MDIINFKADKITGGPEPFQHVVIDDFFLPEIAEKLVEEFPSYDDPVFHTLYDNPIEKYKKTCNHWDKFPKTTYYVFNYLNSNDTVNDLSWATTTDQLLPDPGLHGGGWHIHKRGGKLNIHKDYSIHPKLGLERRLNLIVYLTPDWKPEWGGGLELWSHDEEKNSPLKCEVVVENKFNRAVIFDTTQNSWHGLPNPLECPEDVYRKSIAVYYLSVPRADVDPRKRALFSPSPDQVNNIEVLKLIEDRSK